MTREPRSDLLNRIGRFITAAAAIGTFAIALAMHTKAQDAGTSERGILTPGSKIVFSGDRDGREAFDELYMMNGDETGERRLTPTTDSCHSIHARFSPDRQRIAFTCFTDSPPFSEIYLIGADGTGMIQLTNLTPAGLGAAYPSWSPDGKRIAFVTPLNPNLYVVEVADGSVMQLTHNGARRPDWSPDGRKLTFNRNTTQFSRTTTQVYVADVADPDGSAIQLTSASFDNPTAANQNPRWSPDGQKITFESTRDGNREIYVMNADGTNPVRLTNYSDTDGFPSFSPDGRWIVFARQLCTIPDHEPPNGADLFAVAVDGSQLLQLTNKACPDGSFSAFATWAHGNPRSFE